ncbi:glycine betaine/L-proline ABC transporter ATP-binding protein ProV [Marinobacter bryozoorum]|uniref:glycine betaine/L-proline ABC transporter ATP-binding protein ProV n=1 Tax=Marinobacter bryozoorum TaxID=256324 RepID=UPI002002B9F1|nr:glycine betaine/L-proline ABC transporter ATP-binding protein ProV [Marinobacter bryozoorum]MCK7545685.1 glycine betaine/L-proline ABC transporter ATP-binding protein ProV [Marinobacter bryozoorum]
MTPKLSIRNVFKIFGDYPEDAFRFLEQGYEKDAIFERTGQTIGVHDASFDIHEGEIFVIMGLSGSGKSTMVRLLNRLIEPTSGQILFNGKDIAKMSDEALRGVRRKQISMVFQSFALMPHMTVLQNAAFGLELSSMPVAEREQRARSALSQVGLEHVANSYPDELSGGMQQRVGLARALANDPEVMLMDEAFSALDPLIRTEMQDELLKLQAEARRTVVFISHDLDEAMRIGDRIAIMEGGKVVQVGAPDEILKNPANDYVRSFFRNVDVTSIYTAGDIARKKALTIIEREGSGITAAKERLRSHDEDYGYVVSSDQHFRGVVSVESLLAAEQQEGKLSDAFLETPPLNYKTPLSELIGQVASSGVHLPVVDDDGRYLGVISRAILLKALDRDDKEAA